MFLLLKQRLLFLMLLSFVHVCVMLLVHVCDAFCELFELKAMCFWLYALSIAFGYVLWAMPEALLWAMP